MAATTCDKPKLRWARYHYMADVIPEGKSGNVEVKHFTICAGLNARWAAHPEERICEGRYAQLLVGGGLMMSDTVAELESNDEAVTAARGDVLIAGLGLGLITLPILQKPSVRSVTVIEKSPHVVRLIEDHLRNVISGNQSAGFLVWTADIHKWLPKPENVCKFDYIYFDIWPNICVDDVDEMKQLHRAFRPYLRKGGKLTSWNYEHLCELRREGRWR